MLIQNNNLKSQLISITQRIEENLFSKNRKKEFITEDSSINDFLPVQQLINKYKEGIEQMKEKMNCFYNLKRIENLENDIRISKDKLNNMQSEFNVLNNIQKNQNKALTEYTDRNDKKNEVKMLNEKLKILKEEYRYSKDLLKNTENKLKTQNAIFVNLNEKCDKIRDNIEYRQKFKDEVKDQNQEQVILFEDKVKHSEVVVVNQEKLYKNELVKQKTRLTEVNDELILLSIQLKEKEHEIRINELKLKELKNIKNYQSEIHSIADSSPQKINGRALSAKTHELRKVEPINSRTPNIGARNNFKPFNDIRFHKTKLDTNEDFNRDEMMKQIENLSNIDII
jgi:hypothetical protein